MKPFHLLSQGQPPHEGRKEGEGRTERERRKHGRKKGEGRKVKEGRTIADVAFASFAIAILKSGRGNEE
jgi:hypothetical protein